MTLNLISYLPALKGHTIPVSLCLMSCFILFTSCVVNLLNGRNTTNGIAKFLMAVLKKPTLFLITIYTLFLALYGTSLYLHKLDFIDPDYFRFALGIFEFITYFWITFNFLAVSNNRILLWS